eukprot:gene12487-12621_t
MQQAQLLTAGRRALEAGKLLHITAANTSVTVIDLLTAAAQVGRPASLMGIQLADIAIFSQIPTDQLAAHVAAQLFVDNELDDVIDICTWQELTEQQQQQQEKGEEEEEDCCSAALLAVLAGAIHGNWKQAVGSCLEAVQKLAALPCNGGGSSSSRRVAMCPSKILVFAMPVSSRDLLNLNEVDLPELARHTSGCYDYSPANSALRRSSRPVQDETSAQSTSSSGGTSFGVPAAVAMDLPGAANLVVHEIFGTDPFSEHVLPALRQVQQQLAAPGAAFLPRAVRVIAAVARCPLLLQKVRLQEQLHVPLGNMGGCGGTTAASDVAYDVSSLLLLQPRKLEMQLDELAGHMTLLTLPAAVLEIDFEQQWPLELNGQVTVDLPALQHSVLLQDWMHQQQQQGDLAAGTAGPAQMQHTPTPLAVNMSASAAPADSTFDLRQQRQQQESIIGHANQEDVCVISWFEADCGCGGWLATRPGSTKYGHWQQSVEFVRGKQLPAATAAEAAAEAYHLRVTWGVDRVMFSLV